MTISEMAWCQNLLSKKFYLAYVYTVRILCPNHIQGLGLTVTTVAYAWGVERTPDMTVKGGSEVGFFLGTQSNAAYWFSTVY